MNNKNLIISSAINYKWSDLEIFIKSLRKHYNGKVIFIVSNLDKETKNKLYDYSIDIYNINKTIHKYILNKNPKEILQLRYFIYRSILNKQKKINNVLICDSRDIFFQNNPFDFFKKKKINFFLEEEKIKNCSRNRKWLLRTVGKVNYEKIKNSYISCSGTILGNRLLILNYLKKMCQILNDFPYKKPFLHKVFNKGIKVGYDQGIHNYVLYSFFINSSFAALNSNQEGLVCTTAWMKRFKFNSYGDLCNRDNKTYSLVHQYDRSGKIFNKKIKKIILNY